MSLDPPRVLLDRSFLTAVLDADSPQHDAARQTYARLVDDVGHDRVRLCALAPDLAALTGRSARGRRSGPLAPVETVHIGLQHRRDVRRMLLAPAAGRADLTRLSPYTVAWCLAVGGFALATPFAWSGVPSVAGALPVLLLAVAALLDIAHSIHPRVPATHGAARVGTGVLAFGLVVSGVAAPPGDRPVTAFVAALGLAGVAALLAVLVVLQEHGHVRHPKDPRRRRDDIDADLALVLVVCHRERLAGVATLHQHPALVGDGTGPGVDGEPPGDDRRRPSAG